MWNSFSHIENPFFVELLKTLRPAYEPPSRDILSGCLLAQETAFVNQAVIKELKNPKKLDFRHVINFIYLFVYLQFITNYLFTN